MRIYNVKIEIVENSFNNHFSGLDAAIFNKNTTSQIPWYLRSSIAVLLFNIFTNKGIPIAVSVPLLHKPLY